MSFEKPQFNAHVNDKNELDKEKAFAVEDRAEMEKRYPTIESIVDDYRTGGLTIEEVTFRFPEAEDQEEVLRLAGERNASESEG